MGFGDLSPVSMGQLKSDAAGLSENERKAAINELVTQRIDKLMREESEDVVDIEMQYIIDSGQQITDILSRVAGNEDVPDDERKKSFIRLQSIKVSTHSGKQR